MGAKLAAGLQHQPRVFALSDEEYLRLESSSAAAPCFGTCLLPNRCSQNPSPLVARLRGTRPGNTMTSRQVHSLRIDRCSAQLEANPGFYVRQPGEVLLPSAINSPSGYRCDELSLCMHVVQIGMNFSWPMDLSLIDHGLPRLPFPSNGRSQALQRQLLSLTKAPI
jgi:hypothetical protein